ncbi:MAG: fumarylacetoacetate hydrolase family protein [Pelagibacterium sp.]|uniref:fumarylacetoacetate hydrolase family protein n=1 Tax=Pelagibacterium sp. TaxID=1967288 RepID=UPI0032ED9674
MKLARFDNGRVGVVDNDMIADITDAAGIDPKAWPPVGMVQLIARFAEHLDVLETLARDAPRHKFDAVHLDCPVVWPNKLIAFPANYQKHLEEMGEKRISAFTSKGQGFFLKSNSSLSGPNEPILLPPIPGREIHHECELAIIIGKGGRSISRANALDHILGYSCLVDVVVRGQEERVMRKSFDTFCPMGPYIVTKDEVADVTNINLSLSINGEVRQSANTRDLIVDIPAMVEMASAVMTLQPGDIIASGTPEGVGPIVDGDVLTIQIGGVGEMMLNVMGTSEGAHSVWDK